MKDTDVSILSQPLKLGAIEAPNRIVMAPLTRCRSAPGRVPTALMAEYYTQRASAGLILTEATAVDPMGVGYPDTPGIWSDEQVEGWKRSPLRFMPRVVGSCSSSGTWAEFQIHFISTAPCRLRPLRSGRRAT